MLFPGIVITSKSTLSNGLMSFMMFRNLRKLTIKIVKTKEMAMIADYLQSYS